MASKEVEQAADRHAQLFGKIYHWTYSKRRKLTLHKGLESKCKRHHYRPDGNRR